MNIAFSFTSIYIKKELIDALTVNKSTFGVLLRLLLISTAIDVLQLLINIFKNRYYPKINMLLTYQLQETLIEAVVNVKYSKFDEPEFYDAMEYALTETNGLTKSIDYLLEILSSSINFIIAIIFYLKYDFIVPLLLIVGIIPYCILKSRLNKYSYDVSKEANSIGRRLSATRHLMISKYYAHEVRSFNMFDFLIGKYKQFVADRIDLSVSSEKKKNEYSFYMSLTGIIMGLLASVRIIFQVFSGIITLGEYTLLQSYVVKMQSSLDSLVNNILQLAERNLYLENLFTFIDESKYESSKDGDIHLIPAAPHKIEFQNVSFSYPTNDKVILDDISFTINPGESILLVGENGAGKSTLLMLLNSFYDNYKGKILIDDVELHSIAQKSIWESISMMFQGGTLLPLTLKENICFDKDFDLYKDECEKYDWFQALVRKFPKGIDTILLTYMYPNGIQPSGGEIQRVKLMRSLLKSSGIIVLDEPSNALDPETEHQIISSIKKIKGERTMIIVSHNLSCSLYVDKIVHIQHGKVVECGSHAELMEQGGEYSRLFKMQAENYAN